MCSSKPPKSETVCSPEESFIRKWLFFYLIYSCWWLTFVFLCGWNEPSSKIGLKTWMWPEPRAMCCYWPFFLINVGANPLPRWVEGGYTITLTFPMTALPHHDLHSLGLDVVQNSNFYPFQRGTLSMSHPQGGLGQQLIIRNQTHE